jgi:hypothetical protein
VEGYVIQVDVDSNRGFLSGISIPLNNPNVNDDRRHPNKN